MGHYARSFHQKRAGNSRYPILASASLKSFKKAYPDKDPITICDVGCSIGELLRVMGDQVQNAFLTGIEYDVKPLDKVYHGGFIVHDLNEQFEGKLILHNLVICQEVLEHVEPCNTGVALNFISRLACASGSFLIFGAAREGQRGAHHVNCRPKSAWKDLLGLYGWKLHPEATKVYLEELKDGGIKKGCYVNNTLCFVR